MPVNWRSAMACRAWSKVIGILAINRKNHVNVLFATTTGKGDHRHYGEKEEAYFFVGVPELIEDFKNDCARLAGWRWEE